jgi:D-inositol-3-phosphate glycosyltransferase
MLRVNINSVPGYAGPSTFGYETDNLRRVAAISFHTSPLATLGGKDAGGMNVYVRELSCHVAKQGLPVDVFSRRTSPETPEIQQICDGVNLITIKAGPSEPVDKNSLYELIPEFAEQMALYAIRSGNRYDVVHAHYWVSGWTAEVLRRYWNTPYALMYHTTAHMKNLVSPLAEHETPLREKTEQRLVSLADSIIAANPDERADLIWRQHAESEKICTIPPGVDTELFRPLDPQSCRETLGIAPSEQVVLFVGRIDPIKGVDTLLNSFKIVCREVERPRLIVVGGDLDEHGDPVGPLSHLKHRGDELGISRFMTLAGSQPQDRLPTYYSAADVVHVPSRYESFGLVAVEAMAAGAPVVASRAGGLIFTVEDERTGYLAPIGDPQKHAEYLVTILTDPQLKKQLGENAHIAAQRFSWDTVASSVIHVYQRLADGYRQNLCCDEEIFA